MRRFVLIIFSLLAVITAVNANPSLCQQHHCIAVVDAGSSGSRVHLFAYDLDSHQSPININERWSKKITPGFASIGPNQEAINIYLSKLFSAAPEQHIPVYFYATAGMRILPEPKQRLYYQALQQWFTTQPQWTLKQAKTITGKEEGILGWLAVNYQLQKFEQGGKPIGVMDMGGVSVQITFPVEDTQKVAPEDLETIEVAGQRINLFVHSFLGLGQTALSQQFLDKNSCFPNGYQLPNHSLAQGDATICQQPISKLVNEIHEVNQIVQPALSGITTGWYVIGGAASFVEDELFTFTNHQFTNQELIDQGNNKACHQQWLELNTLYPTNEYLYGACLFTAYYYSLMVNGYGINPTQPINYLPSNQTADWSLGVVLHQNK